MARNKNSTALFDVIHAAKKPPKASPSASIPTPRWWGKDRKDKKVPQPLPNASSENVGRQQSWLTAVKKNGVTPAVSATAPIAADPVSNQEDVQASEVAASEATAPAKQRFIDRFVNRAAAESQPTAVEDDPTLTSSTATVEAEVPQSAPPVTEPSQDWTDSAIVQMKPAPKAKPARDTVVRVDPSNKELSFRLSYGGLVAIGFIVLMALAIAFIAGQHSSHDTAEATDPTPARTTEKTATQGSGLLAGVAPVKPITADTRQNEVSPNVLNVGGSHGRPSVAAEKNATAPTPPPVALLPIKNTREIGLMYVIIQSYDDQEMAQKACDFITKNSDLKCTVVQGPADWAPRNWYSVVGLQPFAKHDPALPDYERKVRSIGSRFSSNVLNQFTDPKLYTWRADSAESSGDEARSANQ